MNCPHCGSELTYDRYRDRLYCPDCNYKSKRKVNQIKERRKEKRKNQEYNVEDD